MTSLHYLVVYILHVDTNYLIACDYVPLVNESTTPLFLAKMWFTIKNGIRWLLLCIWDRKSEHV